MARSIKQSQDFMAAGLNLIAQALSIYDRDLHLVVCNSRFQEMFDLPDIYVKPGARFADTVRFLVERGEYGEVCDIDAVVANRVEQALAFEPHYIERTRLNGRTISVEGSPLPQGGWVTVYTDISRTKSAEHLLRARSAELSDQVLAHAEELSATNRQLGAIITTLEETKRQLTEAEARIRLTTEMMPAHIAHVDGDGLYTFSNRKLSAVMPGRPSELVGRHISDALGAAAYDRISQNLSKAYAGEASVFEFTDTESSRRIRGAFTPDGGGGVFILSMDITEETQTRVALQQTRRRALATQMVSGVAHDFSNLLTIIMGMQSKLARMSLPTEAQDLVKATQHAARRGGRLLNRIGDMTGSRTYRPSPTDLHGLLTDLKTLATPTLPQATGLSVLDHTPDRLFMLDAGLIQDALLNLILNARDSCGSTGQITVSAHAVKDTWIEISVSDTGPGFSPQALAKAAEPFFSTKGEEGTGLGLSMVYDTVKLAGGNLRLTNTPTGATVILRLPYRTAQRVSGGLVLLVEDNDALRAEVRDMLISLDHSVIEATSVDEAVALTADLPDIALILSDIRIDGPTTGLDLIDRIGTDRIPAVLMTSLLPDDPLFQAALTRAPVLRKPFTRAELGALLHPEAAL